MLYLLLTLLPYRVSQTELDFHVQFVLGAYRGYYSHLAATGLRDRKVLAKIKSRTAYSMTFIFWRHPYLWWKVSQLHSRLLRLKKSVVPLEEVTKAVKSSVIEGCMLGVKRE